MSWETRHSLNLFDPIHLELWSKLNQLMKQSIKMMERGKCGEIWEHIMTPRIVAL